MHFIYLFDPLCGWCYAASRGIAQLAQSQQVDVFATGLFANTGKIMDEAFAQHAWRNDSRIAQITGLPFSETYRQNILQQTQPFNSFALSQACYLLKQHQPAQLLPTLAHLQKRRYVDGCNTSDAQVVQNILIDLGWHDIAAQINQNTTRHETENWLEQGRTWAAQHGAQGVPSLWVQTEADWLNLPSTVLYQDSNHIVQHIQALLAK